jgi:hypothetical protein
VLEAAAQGAPAPAGPQFGEIFAYPNPVRAGKVTFHVETDADGVSFRVYDLAGVLVHSAELAGGPANLNGRPTYEHSWDAAGLSSGAYLYVIQAGKAGQQSRALRKFAVVK